MQNSSPILAWQWWHHFCLSLSLSLSPSAPHAQYRKRFRASYNIASLGPTNWCSSAYDFTVPPVTFVLARRCRRRFKSGMRLFLSKYSLCLTQSAFLLSLSLPLLFSSSFHSFLSPSRKKKVMSFDNYHHRFTWLQRKNVPALSPVPPHCTFSNLVLVFLL